MKIGFSVCDITPQLGIYLTGYGQPERLAESVHSPLQASIMVMEENGQQAAIIGLDWCFVDWKLTQAIRKEICKVTSIPEEHILLACSHTHSAPHTTYARTLGRTAVDPEEKGIKYVFDSIPVIAGAVKEAHGKLRECKAAFGHTLSDTGVSRRGTDENGKVTWFIEDPEQICDRNMTVVCFRDVETDENLGILIHASAHNTAMGAISREISSDWCGVMKRRVRNKYDVPVVFVNGALGDTGPRTNTWRGINPGLHGFSAGGGDGTASAEEVGYRAASDALRVLEDMRDFREKLPLKIQVSQLNIPQELSMSREEAQAVLDRFDKNAEDEVEPDTDYQVAKMVYAAWNKPFEPERIVEQTLISFGPMAIVPFPFEMFSIFSLRLRKYGPFEYTLMISNTNGRNAYLPDRGAFAMGGYEVQCLRTVNAYVIKPEAGDVAVRQSLDALRKMI